MRLTGDPRTLFRDIDGTEIDSDSYTFHYINDLEIPEPKAEGEDLEQVEHNHVTRTVEFEAFESEEHERIAAFAELQAQAEVQPVDEEFDVNYYKFDTLFKDEASGEVYIVDTSRFGYYIISDEEEPSGAYAGIFTGAARRIE